MKNKQRGLKSQEKTNRCYKSFTNRDDHKIIYKKVFDKLVKEKFNGIKKLTHKADHDDSIYRFKNDTVKKNFKDFDNGKEHFRKKNLVK